MTRSAFVSARQNRINDTQVSRWTNLSSCHAVAYTKMTIVSRRIFERTHDGGAYSDHPTAEAACNFDGFRSVLRNVIGLVKGQQSIKVVVASRGDTCSMCDCREPCTVFANCRQHIPIENETGGRRLKGDRRACHFGPDIPQLERRLHV